MKRSDAGWTWTAVVAAFVAGMLIAASGCGARALRSHVEVAQASRTTLDAAAETLEAICTVERLHAEAADGGRLKAIRFAGRCNASADAHETARQLWRGYVEAAMTDGFDAPTALRLFARLTEVYEALRGLVSALGGELPEMP